MAAAHKEMTERHHKEMRELHTRQESDMKTMMERHTHEWNDVGNPGESKAKGEPDYKREDKGTTGTEPK